MFDALADARTYPAWWKPVYIKVESSGAPGIGRTFMEYFKGRLPTGSG